MECTSAGPTGLLKESAVQLVAAAMGKKSFADKRRFISEGLARCCRMVRSGAELSCAAIRMILLCVRVKRLTDGYMNV